MTARAPSGGRVAFAIACATATACALIAARTSLWDRDEPRFAQATVEMLASRDWLVPTFNGELRADKPILVYWLMSVPLRIFGAHAWSARLVSALALGAASLATFAAARRLCGSGPGGVRCAWWSQVLLALAPLALAEGSLATTDATLLACLAGAFAVWVHAVSGELRTRHVLALALCTGLAQLAKGPVALALVAGSCAATLVLAPRGALPRRRLALGAALACALGTAFFLAWALPANAATGGEFLRRGIGHHVLERAAGPLEGHGAGFLASLPYYVPVVWLGLAPASAFLPAAWLRMRARRSTSGALLLAWSAPCFVLMTLVGTKLPHYVLPLAPALAIAAARVITEPGGVSARTWRTCAVVLAGAQLLLAAALFAAPALAGLAGLRAAAWSAGACAVFALVLAVPACWRGAAGRAAAFACGGQALVLALIACAALPVLERAKLGPPLADAVRAAAGPEVRVARFGYVEPSLDFALGRPPLRTLADDAELRAWGGEPGAELLVVPRELLARAGFVPLPPRVREASAVRGLNVSRGRVEEVVVLVREPQ